MITNGKITLYHKTFNSITRLEEWTRYNYNDVWVFKTNGASLNRGIEEGNNLQVRIPYSDTLDVTKFSLGDIVVCNELDTNINTQQDLSCETFNISSINDNFFGNNPHIHLGCR